MEKIYGKYIDSLRKRLNIWYLAVCSFGSYNGSKEQIEFTETSQFPTCIRVRVFDS